MNRVKIALLQILPTGSVEGNLKAGIESCRRAKELGAELALFPEMWSSGYDIHNRPKEIWTVDAVSADSSFVRAYGRLAEELGMAIGVTVLETWEGGPRNTLILFDCHGRQVLRYAKVHTCDFDAEAALTPGGDFYTVDLELVSGCVRVGAMICYDREFPESARILMLQGTELILVPNACPMEKNRLAQLRARAFENMLCIATCNYPKGVSDCNGCSSVFDGIALKEDDDSYDMCLLLAGETPGIYIAELDLAALRKYRETEMQGNTYRRPTKYHMLIDEEIKAPFVRGRSRF